MRWVDAGTGTFFVLLGVFVLWQGAELPFFARNSPGPGFLPVCLAVVCIVAGAALALKQIVRPSREGYASAGSGGTARVLAVFGLLVLVVFVLEPLGFIVSMLLLMAGLMFGIERKFTVAAVMTVALVPLVFWTLFAVLLNVRLPEGVLYF